MLVTPLVLTLARCCLYKVVNKCTNWGGQPVSSMFNQSGSCRTMSSALVKSMKAGFFPLLSPERFTIGSRVPLFGLNPACPWAISSSSFDCTLSSRPYHSQFVLYIHINYTKIHL